MSQQAISNRLRHAIIESGRTGCEARVRPVGMVGDHAAEFERELSVTWDQLQISGKQRGQ